MYAYAGDTHYHLQCYLHLKDLARAKDCRVSACPSVLTFTSVAIAQIVALIEASDCSDNRETDASCLEEYLPKILPKWKELS